MFKMKTRKPISKLWVVSFIETGMSYLIKQVIQSLDRDSTSSNHINNIINKPQYKKKRTERCAAYNTNNCFKLLFKTQRDSQGLALQHFKQKHAQPGS